MKSLQFRILAAFSLMILLFGLILGHLMYSSSRSLVVESFGNQARLIGEQAVTLIDLNRYASIDPARGENDYYRELRRELNEMREAYGLKYLYTMGRQMTGEGYVYYYMVDGLPEGAEEVSALGEVEEYADELPLMTRTFDTGTAAVGEISNTEEYGAIVSAYIPILAPGGEVVGILGADFDAEEIYSLLTQARVQMLLTTLLLVLICIAVAYGAARFILNPVRTLTAQVEKVRRGQFDMVRTTGRRDEIGKLSEAFQHLADELKGMIMNLSRSAAMLIEASDKVAASAEQTARTGRDMSDRMKRVAEGADVQLKGSTESARALEEMAAGIERIAESSGTVAEASQQTAGGARQGHGTMEKAQRQMEAIRESSAGANAVMEQLNVRSQEIGEIVEIISGIAAQTNLLALNASIEAARAGEQGRGFAVVAGEVRKLAGQCEESARQVSQRIEDIQALTVQGVEAMDNGVREVQEGIVIVQEAREMFHRIMQAADQVAQQIQEVSAASQQMSASSEQVTASVEELSRIAGESAGYSAEMAGMSEQQLAAIDGIAKSGQALRELAVHQQEHVSRFRNTEEEPEKKDKA